MLKRFGLLICSIALICPTNFGQSIDQGTIIPEGTEIQLTLREPLSSKLNEPGDEVIATLRRDVVADGFTYLRQGTEFIGRVTMAQSARRPFKGGQLHIAFQRVRIDGREQKLSAVIKSASNFARDEKIKGDSEGTLKGGKDGGKVIQNVGIGAGLGGLGATIIILASADGRGFGGFGGIGGGGSAAAASALGGGAVAGMLLTKGKEVRLDPNTIIRLKLERPLRVD
jgi:hypothetical protein